MFGAGGSYPGIMTSPAAPQPPVYGAPSVPSPLSPADEKLWATLIHLGGLFFGFLAPLIGYLILKDRGPFVRAHAATALNFQLTLLIAYVVGSILTVVLIGFFIRRLLTGWRNRMARQAELIGNLPALPDSGEFEVVVGGETVPLADFVCDAEA